MLKPRLTEEQRNALDEHHGLVEVDEEGRKYILMSIEIYRDMLGLVRMRSWQLPSKH
ncbi:hypothetical protein [Gimesia alba]|nr:hypothetical protein [Gimesia alba]